MPNDLVRLACEQAADRFGSYNTFNGSNFAAVFAQFAGCEGRLDGRYVRAILAGRSDVEVLPGDSHYRLLDRDCLKGVIVDGGGKP